MLYSNLLLGGIYRFVQMRPSKFLLGPCTRDYSQIISACFRISRLLLLFRMLHLHENMVIQALRADRNPDLVALHSPPYLLRLREGRLQVNEMEIVDIPSFITLWTYVISMIQRVLLNVGEKYRNEIWMRDKTILTRWNTRKEGIDSEIEYTIPGIARKYLRASTVQHASDSLLQYLIELLDSVHWTAPLPNRSISLKPGYMMMICKVLLPKNGKLNLTRYIDQLMSGNVLL